MKESVKTTRHFEWTEIGNLVARASCDVGPEGDTPTALGGTIEVVQFGSGAPPTTLTIAVRTAAEARELIEAATLIYEQLNTAEQRIGNVLGGTH